MNKINQNWVFGNNAGLNFSTATTSAPPTATTGFAINTSEGCASISDANGNLLFYTDGLTIWDNTHTQKYTGLEGNSSSSQSSIIVPDPGNASQYYIFTADGRTGSNKHFNGVRLNINTWNVVPLSALIATMPATAGYSPVEKLIAVQHKNCKDFWVITIIQKGDVESFTGTGIFRVFSIDSGGVTHIGDTAMNNQVADIGYLKVSHDGQKLAVANGENLNVLIYPFDNTTGIINNASGVIKTISMPTPLPLTEGWVYGVEFSPNNQVLYFSFLYWSAPNGYLYQIDLTQTTMTAVQVEVIPLLPSAHFAVGALQLGVDNRIYFAREGNVVGAILSPDTLGVGCNINPVYITLPSGANCALGLPNILPNACEHACDCGGCAGCNKDAKKQNEELIDRAKTKFNVVKSNNSCVDPFSRDCTATAINEHVNVAPCFYFHWGDGINDQIEEHDTEVFYITVCNAFSDVQFNGLRITKITVIPDVHPLNKIQLVPDRFISYDCLPPCTCQTREFAFITRADNTAGNYRFEVEYCYDDITIRSGNNGGRINFDFVITED